MVQVREDAGEVEDEGFVLYLEGLIRDDGEDSSASRIREMAETSIPMLHSEDFHESVFQTALTALMASEPHVVHSSVSCIRRLVQLDRLSSSSLTQLLKILKEKVYQEDEELRLKILELLVFIMQAFIDLEDEEVFIQLLRICFYSVYISYPASKSLKNILLLTERALLIYYKRVEMFEGYTKKEDIAHILSSESNADNDYKNPHSEVNKFEETHSFKEFLYELSIPGKSGLCLIENLISLASFGKSEFLQLKNFPRPLAFEFLKYALFHNSMLFIYLSPYHQTLHNLCSLLSSSLQDASDSLDISHFHPIIEIIKVIVKNFSSSILYSECESLLTLLIDSIKLDLPIWHHILVLQMIEYIFSDTRIVGNIYHQYCIENTNIDLIKTIVDKISQYFELIHYSDVNDDCFVFIEKWFSNKGSNVIYQASYDKMDDTSLTSYSYIFSLNSMINLSSSIYSLVIKMEEMEVETEIGKETRQILIRFYQQLIESVFQNILNAAMVSLSRVNGASTASASLKIYQNFIKSSHILKLFEIRDSFLSSLCNITKNKINYASNIDKKRMELFYLNFCLSISEHLRSIFDTTIFLLLSSDCFSLSSWDTIIELFFSLHEFFPILSLSPEKISTLESHLLTKTSFELEFFQKLKINDETKEEKERRATPNLILDSVGENQEIIGVGERERRAKETSEGTERQMTLEQLIYYIDKELFSFSRHLSDDSLKNLVESLCRFSSNTFGMLNIDSDTNPNFSIPKDFQPSDRFRSWPTEKMIVLLSHNIHRLQLFWDDLSLHLVELAVHKDYVVRQIALEALGRSIALVLNSDLSSDATSSNQDRLDSSATSASDTPRQPDVSPPSDTSTKPTSEPDLESESGAGTRVVTKSLTLGQMDVVECVVVRPLTVLCDVTEPDVKSNVLSIILNILQNNGDKLSHSWPDILQLLRVASCFDKS